MCFIDSPLLRYNSSQVWPYFHYRYWRYNRISLHEKSVKISVRAINQNYIAIAVVNRAL